MDPLHLMAIQLQHDEECNTSLSPGDGNSDSLCLLQQPTGVSGSGEDQEGAGCHADDGGHQYASCTEHDCPVQPRGEAFRQCTCIFVHTSCICLCILHGYCVVTPRNHL